MFKEIGETIKVNMFKLTNYFDNAHRRAHPDVTSALTKLEHNMKTSRDSGSDFARGASCGLLRWPLA